jgi:hypothetical protein
VTAEVSRLSKTHLFAPNVQFPAIAFDPDGSVPKTAGALIATFLPTSFLLTGAGKDFAFKLRWHR